MLLRLYNEVYRRTKKGGMKLSLCHSESLEEYRRRLFGWVINGTVDYYIKKRRKQ